MDLVLNPWRRWLQLHFQHVLLVRDTLKARVVTYLRVSMLTDTQQGSLAGRLRRLLPLGTWSYGRAAPPGIVIWDLENCAIPARFNDQLPALVKALRSSYRASRVVTAAEIPATNTAKTDQLRTLSYCDVEVLTFLRPDSNSSAKKHSSADYMLKRALQRFLSSPCQGSRVTLITSDADFISDIYHVQDFGLQVHLLCDVERCSSVLKEAADTFGDWKAFLCLHCDVPSTAGEWGDMAAPQTVPATPSRAPALRGLGPSNPARKIAPSASAQAYPVLDLPTTPDTIVLSSYAPHVTQTSVNAHATHFANQVRLGATIHVQSSPQRGFYAVIIFMASADAAAAVKQRLVPVGGQTPIAQQWTEEVKQSFLGTPAVGPAPRHIAPLQVGGRGTIRPAAAAVSSRPSSAPPARGAPAAELPRAPNGYAGEPQPVTATSVSKALTVRTSPHTRAGSVPSQVAGDSLVSQDDAGKSCLPGSPAAIVIVSYPSNANEAAIARHAREFAAPFGTIFSLFVKQRPGRGLHAIVTFSSAAAAAAAAAQQYAPPLTGHLPHILLWTKQLQKEFDERTPLSPSAPAPAASSHLPRPALPSNALHPRDAFMGRGSAVPGPHIGRGVVSPHVPGHMFILISGHSPDLDAEGRASHAASAFEGISGLSFIAATRCHGRDQAPPAVLISLSLQAATSFANKHIYGLEMLLPGGPLPLKWERLSLAAARKALGMSAESNVNAAGDHQPGHSARPRSAPAGPAPRSLSTASRSSSREELRSPTSQTPGPQDFAPSSSMPQEGIQPVTLLWKGSVSPGPAPGPAQGHSVLLIQGWPDIPRLTGQCKLGGPQMYIQDCCKGIDGIHFCITTYDYLSRPIALLSLTTHAALAFSSQYADGTIPSTTPGQPVLTWKDCGLSEAGQLIQAPCKWAPS
ncbi:hypothetical protein WJX84_004053 [Apatococcus fuscideae]|uniref:NYN domain-containing protein n=1 Tax=Apatococcus fuscideae TaxID=2026836 RepID=A0AAW1TDN3_9CHLO